MNDEMKQKAEGMLKTGAVSSVLGWKKGGFAYDPSPAFFSSADELDALIYNGFCGSNLSKYLAGRREGEGKTMVFLKPCDTYSLNQLLAENRLDREAVYVVGVGCKGMIDMDKLRDMGVKGVLDVQENGAAGAGEDLVIRTLYGEHTCPRKEVLLEKCVSCKGKAFQVCDESIGDAYFDDVEQADRFVQVDALEALSPDERFAFWRGELSKCIRCNACKAACPVCTCRTCVFDSTSSGVGAKANANDFEENLYHIIRAFHVAGRCTDCGECSRVCPQGIPLHLLNRKLIKDINTYFGEYQAGTDPDLPSPLLNYDQEDAEPDVIYGRKGAR
ncbi:MAG: 4Fe-4S dicluster domain-containing protein [Clostridiales bacterium]|nr:4Fe-4S dicluster domain-containing protein [Clostridiales bacterium]